MTSRAFEDIWIPLQGRFYRIAFYILENEADARDAVQDLYLKLWNLRDRLEFIREPVSYGSLMMRNLCIDRIRKRFPSDSLKEDMAVNGPPDEDIELKEQLEGVRKAMEGLPESQRKLLKMKVIEGLDYSEIEKRTGLSGLNIRVQVSLARKRLKQLL